MSSHACKRERESERERERERENGAVEFSTLISVSYFTFEVKPVIKRASIKFEPRYISRKLK